jgi:hypothetical protein
VISGKGFYIWQIPRVEAGDPSAISSAALQAGLSHVLIKIADGENPYNINSSGQDLVPPLVLSLHQRSIQAWGWHYVYGYEPIAEADIAIQRIVNLGLDGYVIDAEAPYKQTGKDLAATEFMNHLRASLPNFPIALSSYRYPTYHPQLPWAEFLEKCDYNMPQVYWVGAHNPGEQLQRSVSEFQALAAPFRPIIPTGSAYKEGDWIPTVDDINAFLGMAQALNLSAANFWEWGHTRLYLPELWNTVANYYWPPDYTNQDITERYIAALNTHNPDSVLALYLPDAVHVTVERTIQGFTALRTWFGSLFNQILPGASFSLTGYTSQLGSRHFTWRAVSSGGRVDNGDDTLGLVNGKIIYHYTSFSITR